MDTIDARQSDGGGNVSISMAQNYNAIREELESAFADVGPHLPPKIDLDSQFEMLGKTAATRFDLQCYTSQMLGLLDNL